MPPPLNRQHLDVKWRSKLSEKLGAQRFKGRTQIASGALRHAKGDIVAENYLIEDKFTDASSYSLKKVIWQKISKEAFAYHKRPMMRINIDGEQLCVLSEEDLLLLINNQK